LDYNILECVAELTLTLFMPRICANHSHYPVASDNFAIPANFFY